MLQYNIICNSSEIVNFREKWPTLWGLLFPDSTVYFLVTILLKFLLENLVKLNSTIKAVPIAG